MTITEMLKPGTIPCYFTLDELKYLIHCVNQSHFYDDHDVQHTATELLNDKIAHEEEMQALLWPEDTLEKIKTTALQYPRDQYKSRYHRS